MVRDKNHRAEVGNLNCAPRPCGLYAGNERNKTMTKRDVMASVRAACGVKRLDPRRLYAVRDGDCTWIGDRADLDARDARALRVIEEVGLRPDLADTETRRRWDEADYDAICGRCRCISATHGSDGVVDWDELPEDWKDGSALGPIRPL